MGSRVYYSGIKSDDSEGDTEQEPSDHDTNTRIHRSRRRTICIESRYVSFFSLTLALSHMI